MADPNARYEREAPEPAATTMRETIRYLFDEIERRAYHSTKGLTDADLNADPGHGAMSIGAILHHQLRLVRFIVSHMDPAALEAYPFPPPELGTEGDWHVEGFLAYRETLNELFRRVFAEVTDERLMSKPDIKILPAWVDFPILMRILRPLADLATHVGQVNYARRQMDKPVGRT